MKKVFKAFIYIFIISLIAPSVLADNKFANDIKSISFDKNTVGTPEIHIAFDKEEAVRVIKKDDLEYVILLPETSNSVKGTPSLDKVSDLIQSVEIKTQPYTGNLKGYSKITIKTNQPIKIKPVTSIAVNQKPQQKNIVTKTTDNVIQKVAEKTPVLKTVQTKPQKQETEEILLAQAPVNTKTKQPQIKQNIPIKKEPVVNKRPNVQPQKVKENVLYKKQIQETKPKKQETETTKEESKPTVVEQPPVVEENITPTQESVEEVQQLTENNEDIPFKKAEKEVNKLSSLYTSLGITGVLLILLLLLKRFNKKHGNVRPQEIQDSYSENTEENITVNNQLFAEELPYHEQFEHINDEVENIEIFDESTFEKKMKEEPEISVVEEIPTEISENTIQEEVDIKEEIKEPEHIEPLTEPEPYKSELMETVNVQEISNEDFNNNASLEDLFGETEEILDQAEPTIESIEEVNDIEPQQIIEEKEIRIEPESFIAELASHSQEPVEEFIQKAEQVIPEVELPNQTDTVAQTENLVSEDNEPDENDVIKGSYELTPTKSLYLVNYENSTVLLAAIKDEFTILKRFDEVIDKPLIVRQTEKTTKKTSYIVRVGQFRGIVDVTMKNVEMVLEL